MFRYYARWENSANGRYYEIRLGKDLFGWCLSTSWGRKGTRLGQLRHQPCTSFAEGKKRLEIIARRRKTHGYLLILAKEE